MRVEFLGPLKRPPLELELENLSELKKILSQDEGLREWLELCAVALNDELVLSEDASLKSGDRICLLPPVCGG